MVGILLSILGYFLAPFMFALFEAIGNYLQMATTCINVILFGTVFFMFNYSLNAILVARGDTKTYRNTLIFGFFANIVLNYIFIYGFWFIPALGIGGLALATIIIQIMNMLYMFVKVLKTGIISFDKLKAFLPDIKIYKEFLEQGLPACLNMFTMGLGSLLLTYFVADYGVEAIAGYGIGFRVEQLMLLSALGLKGTSKNPRYS